MGGLHLKPTLIRTTDAQMADQLSLRCPRLHPHDPVEGAPRPPVPCTRLTLQH